MSYWDNERGVKVFTLLILVSLAWLPLGGCLSEESRQKARLKGDGIQTGSSGRLMREVGIREEREKEMPKHLHFLWQSKYVSQGRDNLYGGGIETVTTDIEWGALTFSPWYAQGYDSDYDELNLNLVFGWKFGEGVEIYTGYTHLRFFEDRLHDDEFVAGLVLSYLKLANFFVTNTYSVTADGYFIETGFSREISISDQITLNAAGLLGVNSEYIVDGHKGMNNFQLMLEIFYRVNLRMEVMMFLGCSWAIDSDLNQYEGDGNLGDFFWGGVGFTVHF